MAEERSNGATNLNRKLSRTTKCTAQLWIGAIAEQERRELCIALRDCNMQRCVFHFATSVGVRNGFKQEFGRSYVVAPDENMQWGIAIVSIATKGNRRSTHTLWEHDVGYGLQ